MVLHVLSWVGALTRVVGPSSPRAWTPGARHHVDTGANLEPVLLGHAGERLWGHTEVGLAPEASRLLTSFHFTFHSEVSSGKKSEPL